MDIQYIIQESCLMAVRAHGDQTYGGHPYVVHPNHVVEVLVRFGIADPEVLAAGYLHDTLEDTDLTIGSISSALTERIASLVWAVTDGPGKNRKERHAQPYRLIPLIHGALEVKLTDRIANVEHAWATGNTSMLKMYKDEQVTFFDALWVDCPPQHLRYMWDYLELLLYQDY